MIKISDVIKDIEKSQSATYHRGKSWEHCYVFFRKYKKFRNDNDLLDRAALHLGFFLASWGMLRGSSFLLQKDYKFYVPIVRILIDQEYDRLWSFNFSQKLEKRNLDLLFDLKEKLKTIITNNNKTDGDHKKHETDLLITKIIMATMGCVPAYDRYFKDGIKKKIERIRSKEAGKKKFNNFNKDSFKNLLNLSRGDENLKEVYRESWYIQGTNIKYPPMKLLDLYFWLLGQPSG
jgi:hypothetical protein